ncbi:MAG: DUF2752 domain-containing protein [Planctomycetota bacterium]
MAAPDPPKKIPFTIPLAAGPVAPWLDRLAAALVLAAAVAAVAVLWPLTPDPRGFDTHTQLGLSPCSWPEHYGYPCPTCGSTTAACHVVHGQLLRAFAVQPFGAAVAVAGLLLAAHAAVCLLRKRSFADLLVRLPGRRVLLGAVLLLLAAWGYVAFAWRFLHSASLSK